ATVINASGTTWEVSQPILKKKESGAGPAACSPLSAPMTKTTVIARTGPTMQTVRNVQAPGGSSHSSVSSHRSRPAPRNRRLRDQKNAEVIRKQIASPQRSADEAAS